MSQPQTVLEVLEAMDQKLSDESKWTKGNYARDKDGIPVQELSPQATCWCLIGCAIAVSPDPYYPNLASALATDALDLLRATPNTLWSSLAAWNDFPARTFAEVKHLLQQAKELAQ